MPYRPRRIVTGHDVQGKSVVLSDGGPPVQRAVAKRGAAYFEMWATDAMPAPVTHAESETVDRPMQVPPLTNGTVFRIIEWQPGHAHVERHMHRTETIDYAIVLQGNVVMFLDDQEVQLNEGDVVIQRGTDHAWLNRSDKPARMAFILVDGRFSEELKASFGDEQKIMRSWSGAKDEYK